jgi:hypothetical protein
LLGFQVDYKINKSILQQKWPRNSNDEHDNPYKSLILAYNIEMDQLVPTNIITISKVEELISPTCLEGVMTNSKDVMANSEETTSLGTPRS